MVSCACAPPPDNSAELKQLHKELREACFNNDQKALLMVSLEQANKYLQQAVEEHEQRTCLLEQQLTSLQVELASSASEAARVRDELAALLTRKAAESCRLE